MTKKELIDQLKDYPDDIELYLYTCGGYDLVTVCNELGRKTKAGLLDTCEPGCDVVGISFE